MIASILARTCSVVSFDAFDPARRRFDSALAFISYLQLRKGLASGSVMFTDGD